MKPVVQAVQGSPFVRVPCRHPSGGVCTIHKVADVSISSNARNPSVLIAIRHGHAYPLSPCVLPVNMSASHRPGLSDGFLLGRVLTCCFPLKANAFLAACRFAECFQVKLFTD